MEVTLAPDSSITVDTEGSVENPKLWGVPPTQTPNRYVAYTWLHQGEMVVDSYKTPFGIRQIEFDGDGFTLNGERIKMDGVCLHHDLGALGAAANVRARERQLEILQEMGANGIRTAHNPFEPAFYDLADRMGFLVMDEAFDVWATGKAALDHSQFFDEWHEQDLRALLRRDRNHPSVVIWSIGNVSRRLVLFPGRGVRVPRQVALRGRRIRLDRVRLSRRTDAPRCGGAQLVLRYRRPRRTQEGSQRMVPTFPFSRCESSMLPIVWFRTPTTP